MWPAIIAGGASLLGSWLSNKDSAKSPSAPPPLDLDELARLMMTNTKSPWGGMTYTEGDDGQWQGEYKFSDEIQPIFDRQVQRSLTPDQAYQMPEQLRSLQTALMEQRLNQPERRATPERRPFTPTAPPEGYPTQYKPYGG